MTSPLPAQNPILAELSNLSPGAKTALINAHTATSQPSAPMGTQPSPQSTALLSPQPQPTLPKLQAPSANSSPAQIGASAPQRTLSTQSAPAAPPMQAPKIDAPTRQAAAAMTHLDAQPAPSLLTAPMTAPTHPNLEALPSSSTIITGPKRGEEMYSSGQQILPDSVTGSKIEQERDIAQGPLEERLYHKIADSKFGQEHKFLGKFLGGAAAGLTGLADVGVTTLGGGFGQLAAELTPGSMLNHQIQLRRDSNAVESAEGNAEKEAQTANLNAQPEIKELQERIAQGKLDEKAEHDRQMIDANLRKQGYKLDETGHPVPLAREELSTKEAAAEDLTSARSDYEKALQDYKAAQTADLPKQMEFARQRAMTAKQNALTAAGRLGLSREALNFHEDEFYNQQPTAHERQTGDYATSAINQIRTMRSILAAHPEFQGPGGEATQAFSRWLSSHGEDAGKFLAARDYLADHSLATFGGRSAYIARQLQSLTSGNFSPSTLNGVLDQAEQTAQHFANLGTPHGKGGRSTPEGVQGPPAGMVQVQIPGQKPGFIPSSALKQFKKDHPNAQEVQ